MRGPGANRSDAVAAGAQTRRRSGGEQIVETRGPRRRDEVALEFVPIVAIALAQHRDETLLGVIFRRVGQKGDKERAVPPADFVIGEIADAERIAAIRRNGRRRFAP